MSVSYCSKCFLGIQAKDLVKVEEKTISSIKYNPDTGVPYEKKESKTEYSIFGKILEDCDYESLEKAVKQFGLKVEYATDGYSNLNKLFIGLPLLEARDYDNRDISALRIGDFSAKVEDLIKIFNELDVDSFKIRIWNVLYCSY